MNNICMILCGISCRTGCICLNQGPNLTGPSWSDYTEPSLPSLVLCIIVSTWNIINNNIQENPQNLVRFVCVCACFEMHFFLYFLFDNRPSIIMKRRWNGYN